MKTARGNQRIANLTPRQRDVGTRIAKGMSNREIAEDLGIHVQVVKNYSVLLYDKFGVENRTQLTIKWLEMER